MATTETGGGVTTDTTDTTDGQSPPAPAVDIPSPYRPTTLDRAMDVGCGLTLMWFGGVLIWRAIKPEEYHEWQSR